MNNRLRRWLHPLAIYAATPMSVLLHVIVLFAWWYYDPESKALVIWMSLEAIIIGLIIIDKAELQAKADHEWQKGVFKEALDKIPDARPEIAEQDGGN